MAATPLQSARSLLARAVELDTAQRYSEALICYEEAIQMLIKCIPGNNANNAVSERPCAVTGTLTLRVATLILLQQYSGTYL